MNIEVKKILSLINDNGYESYVVGGFVRDYLLNIKSNDYDICTNCPLDILSNILSKYNYKIEFSTLKIKINNLNIEITPYRKELEYINRHPKYEYVNSLFIDTKRRDFTINALCMDYNENIIDLCNGIIDINNKIIRCVGNIDIKLNEDPLRILRALRISSKINFDIENNLRDKIIQYGYLLKNISYEVKKKEISKLITYRKLDILKEYDLDKYLDINLDDIIYYEDDILVWKQIDYLNRYIVSNKERNILIKIDELNNMGLTKYNIYKYGYYISNLVAMLNNISIDDIYNNLVVKNRKEINITSYDILNIVNKKEYIEKIYIDLEKNILEERIQNDYNSIIDYLKKIYGKI